MPTLLHPGVYVSEVPAGARSIEGAPTSTTIFVGETERGPLTPTKIKSRTDFERLFGGYFRVRDEDSPGADPTRVLTAYSIDGFYLNGGSTAYVLRAMDEATAGPATAGRAGLVEASSPGLWGNSLSVAFLASGGAAGAGTFRIAVVYESPDTGERRLVEVWDRLSTDPADENYVERQPASAGLRWPDAANPSAAMSVSSRAPAASPARRRCRALTSVKNGMS